MLTMSNATKLMGSKDIPVYHYCPSLQDLYSSISSCHQRPDHSLRVLTQSEQNQMRSKAIPASGTACPVCPLPTGNLGLYPRISLPVSFELNAFVNHCQDPQEYP
uniref:Uncharacterized protein n=1 Tax=Mus musculus TaxID=10090 RepID=Q8C2X9_MOUSE|nr:unnamed protein product [Mus musculus]